MKRTILVLLVGVLIGSLGTFSIALGEQPIKLIVNNQEIQSDVPPQIIDGRTMVPIRAVGQALGCQVSWDGDQRAVIITSGSATSTPTSTTTPAPTSTAGSTKDNPLPFGQSLVTPDGIKVSVTGMVEGDSAWNIIKEANQFNAAPEAGMKYVMINLNVTNISSSKEPRTVSKSDFALVGSSNKVFNTFDKVITLKNSGTYTPLDASLYHGGSASGWATYYVPSSESNYTVIWKPMFSLNDSDKRYFSVK